MRFCAMTLVSSALDAVIFRPQQGGLMQLGRQPLHVEMGQWSLTGEKTRKNSMSLGLALPAHTVCDGG